jgi:hypothetical protein
MLILPLAFFDLPQNLNYPVFPRSAAALSHLRPLPQVKQSVQKWLSAAFGGDQATQGQALSNLDRSDPRIIDRSISFSTNRGAYLPGRGHPIARTVHAASTKMHPEKAFGHAAQSDVNVRSDFSRLLRTPRPQVLTYTAAFENRGGVKVD